MSVLSPSMTHRLNPTSDIDLRVSVLSASGDDNFDNYSEIVVSVKKGNTSTIYRRVNLVNEFKRVDVNFDHDNFFQDETSYTILVKLVGTNNNTDVNLQHEFNYRIRPDGVFTYSLTSSSNNESQSPTPLMSIELLNGVNSFDFEDVVNVNLVIENSDNNFIETIYLPVNGQITKNVPIHLFLNRKGSDISYNKLVLELSGNAYKDGALDSNATMLIKDISGSLIEEFGQTIEVFMTLETAYGNTETINKDITLSRTSNPPQIQNLVTNTTSDSYDVDNLYIEFDIKPNSVDLNNVVNEGGQIKRYKVDISGNYANETFELVLEQDMSDNYVNEFKVRISENGILTTVLDPDSDVSLNTLFSFEGQHFTHRDYQNMNDNRKYLSASSSNISLQPLETYTIGVSAYTNDNLGYSDPTTTNSTVLEKLPTITVKTSAYGDFLNHTVTNYQTSFNIDVSNTVVNDIQLNPILETKKMAPIRDGNNIYFAGAPQNITADPIYISASDLSVFVDPEFDILNNTSGPAHHLSNLLMTNEVIGKFDCSVSFLGGLEVTLDISGSSGTEIKTMEEVYTSVGVELDDFSLNTDANEDANGFTLTIVPSTEIFEFRNGAFDNMAFYNRLDEEQKSKLKINLIRVDVSNGFNTSLNAGDISSNSGKYVFDVPVGKLGENLTYDFTINNEISGLAPDSDKVASLNLRVNDVRVIDTSFNVNSNTFTIFNKRGYQLDLAILKNQPTDVLEIIHDGELNSNGDPSLNQTYGIIGETTDEETFIFTDANLGVANAELIVSLSDKGEDANNKKEVFVVKVEE